MSQDDLGESHGYTSYHSYLVTALDTHRVEYTSSCTHNPSFIKTDEAEEKRIVLCLLAAASAEAVINLYLSLYLTPEQFKVIERGRPVEKWKTGPTFIARTYGLLPELTEQLEDLFNARNGLMHLKPKIIKGAEPVPKGKGPGLLHERIIDWTTLPERLLQNLKLHDPKADNIETPLFYQRTRAKRSR